MVDESHPTIERTWKGAVPEPLVNGLTGTAEQNNYLVGPEELLGDFGGATLGTNFGGGQQRGAFQTLMLVSPRSLTLLVYGVTHDFSIPESKRLIDS